MELYEFFVGDVLPAIFGVKGSAFLDDIVGLVVIDRPRLVKRTACARRTSPNAAWMAAISASFCDSSSSDIDVSMLKSTGCRSR